MTILSSILLGLIEGITEFLPISSTAHLIVASNFLGIPQSDFQKFFEVFIQSGAILAVVVLYFKYVLKHIKIWKTLLFSFVPTAVIGLLLYKIIKSVFFESNLLIIGAIAIVGVIFIVLEYIIRKNKIKLHKSISQISLVDAVIIGLAQAIAVVPGVSRSGIVMVAMMSMGYRRDESALYSFLLAVPTLVAASGLDLWKMRSLVSSSGDSTLFVLIGFVVSFITAYIVIKWLIQFLQKNTLTGFGVYRIILGAILFMVLER